MAQFSLRVLAAACIAIGSATIAGAQAQTGILSLNVAYNTLKNTSHPEGALKAQIDTIDTQLAAARALGRTAEQRRLYAKGFTLLNHRPWTPEAEFASALLLRTEHQVVDPSHRWTGRVEMDYLPSMELTRPLSAHMQLRQRTQGTPANTPLAVVKELGAFDGVSRDLRDAPFVVEADLHDVADGSYVMTVELLDSTRTLGTAALQVVVRHGLDATIARLETAAAKTAEPVRSDLRFPADRLHNVNLSRLTLGTFSAAHDFAAAESLLAAVNTGKDPWKGRTGDLKRHYLLKSADEIMPYHLYIPKAYTPAKPLPLIIALHGLGGTEDNFFDAYGHKLPELAEQRGYMVAAPLGYRVDGAYGVTLGASDPGARRTREFSEEDVLQVLDAVRSQYKIDPNRIYLMGHSMGAIGTWAIAAKYPDRWTALGLFAGYGAPATARIIGAIPQFVVHGDADPTVNVSGSRTMVAALKGVGADVMYMEIPGGNHVNVVEPNLPAMFDFFDKHAVRPATKP